MCGIKHDSKHALTSQAQTISEVIPTATAVHATAHLGKLVLLGTGAAGLIC